MTTFPWTEASEKAAQLIALGRLTLGDIAASVDVARSTLWEWRQDEEFQARVAEHLAEIRAEVRRVGLATVEARVAALNDRWSRMRRVIEARADDPTMQAVPGGRTGLLVRSTKGIGSGDAMVVVDEYAVDTGLLKELREHEKQAAQELGQWAEKQQLDGVMKVVIQYADGHPDSSPAAPGPGEDPPGDEAV